MNESLGEQLRATLWDTPVGRVRPWFRFLLAILAGALAGYAVASWAGFGMGAAMALGNAGGPGTVATFESECGECFEPIEVGDRIIEREGHWGHFECPTSPRGPNASRWDGTDDETMGY